jgi:hypothetical protein
MDMTEHPRHASQPTTAAGPLTGEGLYRRWWHIHWRKGNSTHRQWEQLDGATKRTWQSLAEVIEAEAADQSGLRAALAKAYQPDNSEQWRSGYLYAESIVLAASAEPASEPFHHFQTCLLAMTLDQDHFRCQCPCHDAPPVAGPDAGEGEPDACIYAPWGTLCNGPYCAWCKVNRIRSGETE